MTPGGIIWKLQPTPGGILIGEARDVEMRTTSLFALRPSTGEKLFTGTTLDEPWWIALEMTIGEIAILHAFPKPDMPSAIGATAVDCETGRLLWSDPAIHVICGIEELALVRRGAAHDRGALEIIDARSGALVEAIGDDPSRAAAFQEACASGPQWRGWISTRELDGTGSRDGTVTEALDRVIRERRGPAEIAEYGTFTVAAAHQRSRRSPEAMLGNLVDARLLVLDGDRILHDEVIERDAPAPASDLFFIWNGVVVYIRDRRTLTGINLMRR
jgi:hypothetical protein